MARLSRLFHCLSTLLLLAGSVAAPGQAQQNPAPAPAPPPANPATPAGSEAVRMAPTGLAANGGSIVNDVYTNTTYGFTMKLPPGWVVVPANDPVVASKDPKEEALMQAAQTNHVLLLTTENAPMKKHTQRKSIQIIATRLLQKPHPNEGQQYLVYSKRTALEKKMPVEYLGDPAAVTIHGSKVWTIGLNQTTGEDVQRIQQYVATQGSVLLQFMFVSPDEKGLKDLQPSMRSINLNPSAKKTTPAPAMKKKPAAPAK
jgi:hypothetical protein